MDKTLDNDTLNLEKAFLGGVFCLTSKEELNNLLEIISPKHFSTTLNKEIFNAMEKKFELGKRVKKLDDFLGEQYDKEEHLDTISFDYDSIVDSVLKANKTINEYDLKVYLLEILDNFFFSYDLEEKAKLIVEKAKLREIENLGIRISKLSQEKSITSDEVIEELEREVDIITRKPPSQSIVQLRDLALKQLKTADNNLNGNISNAGYKVGFSVIDDKLNGLSKSDLIIIAGRPSMGKTAFALNVLLDFCEYNKDLSVLFFSLEMPPEQLYFRLVAMDSGIPISKLKYGNVVDDNEIAEKYSLGLSKIVTKNISIADTPTLSLFELKKLAYSQKDNNGLDLIVIDYLQLLSGDNKKGQNKQQEVSDISRGLKQLARELDIPIIALSQLSRSLESRSDKRPLLSDLRESGAIEQDADIVMFLYRDEYYNPNSSDLGIAEIIVAKNRNGGIGTVKMKFDKECTKFTNYTDFNNMD